MGKLHLKVFIQFLLAGLLVFSLTAIAAAQGRGRGGGGGRPAGAGQGSGGGVDRGLGTASQRSGGRSDDGLGRASEKSRGRSDEGLERPRGNRVGNNTLSPNELNRFRGIARKLNTTPEALQSQFLVAQALNPDLKFGQFVAANVVANNLGGSHLNITSNAILAGLQSGRSLGQTLQDLGLSKAEAKAAKRQAEQQIKHSAQ